MIMLRGASAEKSGPTWGNFALCARGRDMPRSTDNS